MEHPDEGYSDIDVKKFVIYLNILKCDPENKIFAYYYLELIILSTLAYSMCPTMQQTSHLVTVFSYPSNGNNFGLYYLYFNKIW